MTTDALQRYEKLVKHFTASTDAIAGQMFGKPCIKVNGKAFIALHKEWVVFKLGGQARERAMSCPGARLWDPSGKNRPMKEWIALPISASKTFGTLATASIKYVMA